jgi:hypothetical protein
MTFVKWLNEKPIKSDKSINNKYLINNLYNLLIKWMNTTEDIFCETDYNTFKVEFFKFIYLGRLNKIKENNLYYELKYNSDIIDLYLEMEDFMKSQGTLIFKSITPNNLLEFLIDNTYISYEENELNETNELIYEEEF